MTTKIDLDIPIPFTLSDAPIPYRIRVETVSPELRAFVVPAGAPTAPRADGCHARRYPKVA